MKDEYIIGKWYAVIFQCKRNKRLYIGKVLHRFLFDENGGVESLEIRYLKPKMGHGTILEVTPSHLPDISNFVLEDVIAGPQL